jgi:FkbM family methyltransferase
MSPQPTVPFTIVVPTIYGQMLVNRYDMYQTNPLFKTGQPSDHSEILLLAQILRMFGPNPTVLDVGANIGTYSLALAQVVGPNGKIHAFEPQRLIYNLLVGTIALNSLTNVYCHNVALGNREDRIEIPQYDYHQPMNFGSVEFTPEQSEPLPQQRGHDPARTEYVPLTTIDRFEFPSVHLMKIDAEGMELQVLQGSAQTIRRCRPVLYVEYLKNNRELLQQSIEQLDYVVYENGANLLCIPTEQSGRFKVKTDATTVPPGQGTS